MPRNIKYNKSSIQLASHARGGYDQTPRRKNKPKTNFIEDKNKAFYLNIEDPTLVREQVYDALRRMVYVEKLDMPKNPNTFRVKGAKNPGYCFVHCKTAQMAQSMIAKGRIKLGNSMSSLYSYSKGETRIQSEMDRAESIDDKKSRIRTNSVKADSIGPAESGIHGSSSSGLSDAGTNDQRCDSPSDIDSTSNVENEVEHNHAQEVSITDQVAVITQNIMSNLPNELDLELKQFVTQQILNGTVTLEFFNQNFPVWYNFYSVIWNGSNNNIGATSDNQDQTNQTQYVLQA